jgi:hypothetical protein
MRGRSVTLAMTAMVTMTVAIAAAMPMTGLVVGGVAAPPPLESLYIVRSFFSDNLSDAFTEVIDATPVGDDVRLRVIRISLATPNCPNKLVRAAETVISRRSLADIVFPDPCALEPAAVEKALNAAKPRVRYALWHDASHKIVARCGGEERVFAFPFPVEVNYKRLKRSNPRVAELWDVCYRLAARVFPDGTSMNDNRPDFQRALEALGDKVLPELISGKYKTAFDAESLRGYKGAPPLEERGLLPVQIHDAAKHRFAKYVAPERSPIMESLRLSGIVHLGIQADPTTGQVTNVEVVRGKALLAAEAVRAARQWQFEPGSVTGQPIDVYLNFTLDCRP